MLNAPPQLVRIWTDGSACPRTRRNAIATGLDDGHSHSAFSRSAGTGTSIDAEFYALAEADRRARPLGPRRVEIRTDCKSVVSPLNWLITHPESRKGRRNKKHLRRLARRLSEMPATASVIYVPRARNTDANRLARAALAVSRRRHIAQRAACVASIGT